MDWSALIILCVVIVVVAAAAILIKFRAIKVSGSAQKSIDGTNESYVKDPFIVSPDKLNEIIKTAKELYPRNVDPNIKAILVPHAAPEYSGVCAAAAFNSLDTSVYNEVILVCVDHNARCKMSICSLEQFPDILKAEHSYRVLSSMVRHYFGPKKPLKAYLVNTRVNPGNQSNQSNQSNDYDVICARIMREFKGNPLVVFTTDLSHKVANSYEGRINAMMAEEDLIKGFLGGWFDNRTTNKWDGAEPLKVLRSFARKLNLKGDIACYTNSIDSPQPYSVIPRTTATEMVNYVSAVFSLTDRPPYNSFHEKHLVSVARDVIKAQIIGLNYDIKLPKWSPWLYTNNGAFVTVSSKFRGKDKVRACIGRYERNERNENSITTYQNVVESARDCVTDAAERWKRPLELQELDSLKYEVSLLQQKDNWTRILPRDFDKLGVGGYGVVMYMKTGMSGHGSGIATYLPSVWRDYKNVGEFLEALSNKAKGQPESRRNENWLDEVDYIEKYTAATFVL